MFYSLPDNVKAMFTTWLPASEYYTYFPELNEDLIKTISDLAEPVEWIIKNNRTFQDIIKQACPDFPADLDISKPERLFDPNGCLDPDTNKKVKPCLEWMKPTGSWSKNIYEQIIRNLEIPMFLTNWDLGERYLNS